MSQFKKLVFNRSFRQLNSPLLSQTKNTIYESTLRNFISKNQADKGYISIVYRDRTEYYKDGLLHRGDDLPAVVHKNGKREWYFKGERHRDHNLPAYSDNNKEEWWMFGKLHRNDDRPAVQCFDGTLEWYKSGNRHRDCTLPAVMHSNGTLEWWYNGHLFYFGQGKKEYKK